jgi:hypothetical protein
VNRFEKAAKDFGWTRVLIDAMAKHPQKNEAVIQDVMTRTKRPRSTVLDYKRRLIPGPAK